MATSSQPPSHLEVQRAFTRHLRDPEHCAAPSDVEERRMRIYRRLFYNNVEGLMRRSFPVLRNMLDETRWHALMRDYFRRHQARTPYFPRLAGEFLKYLEEGYRPEPGDPPFLTDLARFEWAQGSLFFDPREAAPAEQVDAKGDLLAAPPFPNQVAYRLGFQFPVQRINSSFRPATPGREPTYLWLFRRPDGKVRFLKLNRVAARLVDLIDERPTLNGRELLRMVAAELHHPEPRQVLDGGVTLLTRMRRATALLGTRRSQHTH